MTPLRLAALSTICALAATLAAPALALNPQPLPPGIYLGPNRPPQFQYRAFNPHPHPVIALPHCHSGPAHLDPHLAPPPRVCS